MEQRKSYFSRIDSDGNTTVPEEVMAHLGVKEGDSVTFSIDSERESLIVAKADPGDTKQAGS